MKINIGNYPKYYTCNIHSRWMEKRYGLTWSHNITVSDRLMEKLEYGIQTIYNYTVNLFYSKRKRKVSVKLHPSDTWGMYHTLAYIIHPMLIQLKNTKHGSPYTDESDSPHIIGGFNDTMHDRWDYIIAEMIFAFGEIAKDDADDKFDDYNSLEYKEYDARIQNGLRLFAKYYRNLWD